MSDVERMWVGDEGIHPGTPVAEYRSVYLECVRAEDYDALAARLAEAERIMADFLRSWDNSFAGENIDPFRMDEVRAFLRGSVNGEGGPNG